MLAAVIQGTLYFDRRLDLLRVINKGIEVFMVVCLVRRVAMLILIQSESTAICKESKESETYAFHSYDEALSLSDE